MEEQKKAEQQRTNSKDFASSVVRVIKEKEQLVRDAVDRTKCVILFGDIEKEIRAPQERKEADMIKVREVIAEIDEDARGWAQDVEEVRRLGLYKQGEMRPIKVCFKSKSTVEEIISFTWRLNKKDGYKHVTIRRDLTTEERKLLKEKTDEAKRKNEQRSEEEQSQFFWKVCGKIVRKWYVKKEGTERKEGEGETVRRSRRKRGEKNAEEV